MSSADVNFDYRALKRQFPLLAGQPSLHYLDNAATAQLPQVVLDAMVEHECRRRANVQRGSYPLAEAADAAYAGARESVRRFLNAEDVAEVVFTSGTTAGINLFAHAFGARLCAGDEVVVSEAEHHSNFVPWQMLAERSGVRLRMLPIGVEGRIETARLEEFVTGRCKLVAITHCSNVTGAITDLGAVLKAARAVGACVMVDGAQAAQHGPVDVRSLGVDAYAFSGHKCYGPNGVGVLWARADLLASLPPVFGGGGMVGRVTLEKTSYAEPPARFEAGTPPIAQAVGLGAALEWMMSQPWREIRVHQDRLGGRLLAALAAMPDVRILGPRDMRERLPIVSFAMRGVHAHDLAQVLGEHGVCVRGGHHCAQPVHAACGLETSVRASLAPYNGDEDIDGLLAALDAARKLLQ
ncbi:MAG: aminotransferase class V-fold PLP-dependent enzyme [Rhodocyclaceae bacterium]|nr:aminotransferase class V-fold PLP-dependent enzyme [Rhodocyclaceae bacterium]